MMAGAMQVCTDSSEAQELFEPQGLYLKPTAKLSISVQLPQLKTPGKTISNWEVMEKIKTSIKPEQFTSLKVTKSTLEFIRFEGEAENRTHLKTIVSRLDNKTIKLSGFPDLLKVRAAEAKVNFPTRHDWDSYFRDAKNMNEMKPGERPDTIHFQYIPSRWFANKRDGDPDKPSEYMLKKVFETFGDVRWVDIPMLDPYRCEMTRNSGLIQTFSFGQDLTFEAFVQYTEYIGFVKAMTALRGMKLMHKGEDSNCFTANIKVDFDRTKHLSDKNIRKRKLEREKLIQLEKEKEERVRREREEEERKKEEERAPVLVDPKYYKEVNIENISRARKRIENEEKDRELKREEKLKKREEKRRQRKVEKKRIAEEKKVLEKKAQEIRKKLVKSRRDEAARLLGVLFNRVKILKQREELRRRMAELELERLQKIEEEKRQREEVEKNKVAHAQRLVEEEVQRQRTQEELQKTLLAKQEQLLRERLIHNLQVKQEQQRERLRRELSGRTKLRSVLVKSQRRASSNKEPEPVPKIKSVLVTNP